MMRPLETLFAVGLALALPGCSHEPATDGDADGDADADVDADAEADGDTARDGAVDADAPGDSDAAEVPCTFNVDCPEEARCECDEATGCFCRSGPRGTGQNGVDTCEDGEDCESALCVEGADGLYYCSDQCETEEDCGPNLPRCLDVAFLGRVCVRTPP